MEQLEEHPSPDTVLWSSHPYEPDTWPSPHTTPTNTHYPLDSAYWSMQGQLEPDNYRLRVELQEVQDDEEEEQVKQVESHNEQLLVLSS